MAEQEPPVIFLHQVERRYHQGEATLEILRSAELAVWPGQSVALVAPSGVGKSTLLHVAGLLEHPDGGEVYLDGQPTATLSDSARTRLRRNSIGFVYQAHHLLPEFSAVENVMLPQMLRGLSRKDAHVRASELLSYLGLGERLTHRPAELSGGEQQRVAIARAVANVPRLLLADEPTGNLDPRTSDHVFQALAQLIKASGLTVVLATHNMEIAARMDRRVTLRDGQIVEMP
ncbi:ABC transporter ATP-binding protein [Rhodoplanes sp. Z2-YC6860]|uniref:ABC transporter ATP-binding protein n=1 Tax=Rhodoplanes sp. Z2-YC6860 TaxID=674703 RepID=UPI00078C5B4D|nr:ABC transporter ATP-binding protein [Rhodoplanes sp. Z2-YC6860]AMN42328.1 Lipoprotein releasing system ATP-binding protein LolD [Rhodoplanes sp. Z2-YC6860]